MPVFGPFFGHGLHPRTDTLNALRRAHKPNGDARAKTGGVRKEDNKAKPSTRTTLVLKGGANGRRDKAGLSLANPASTGIPRTHPGGYAVYAIVDQMVWKEPGSKDGGIGLFLLAMGAPQSYNLSNLYIDGGMNWKGPFRGRENDVSGFGVAYLGISPAKRGFGKDVMFFTGSGSSYSSNETVLEATYLYQLSPWLTLQPDAQYVINPGAGIPSGSSHTPLKNASIIGIRTSRQF